MSNTKHNKYSYFQMVTETIGPISAVVIMQV